MRSTTLAPAVGRRTVFESPRRDRGDRHMISAGATEAEIEGRGTRQQ